MSDNSPQLTSTFEPISNIRLTRMPSHPQPKDTLYKSGGVMFRLSERFVYKPRLNAGAAWKLYDGVTVPRKEDLILVGNPNKRTSKLVYTLADQADYAILDISEIPFATLATTRNIISAPPDMDFGKQNNDFQFTFKFEAAVAAPRSRIQVHRTPQPVIPTPIAHSKPPRQSYASPVGACIAAVSAYFDFGGTAQKRKRESEDQKIMDINRRQRCRFPRPYSGWVYKRLRV